MEYGINTRTDEEGTRPFIRSVAKYASNNPASLAWLILLVGGLDLVLTVRALDMGWLVELNPLADWVIRHYGRYGLAVFRTAAATFGAILMYWALIRHDRGQADRTASKRVQSVVGVGVVVIVATHVTLLCWWAAWMSVSLSA